MASAVAAVAHASVATAHDHRRREFVKSGCCRGAVSHSTYVSRDVWRISNPRKQFAAVRVRRATTCDWGFDGQRLAEEARRSARAFGNKAGQVFDEIKRKTVDFQQKNDVQCKARRAAKTASLKFEEFSYDLNKHLGKWDRQYRVTEKAQQAKGYATEQACNVDRQYGLRQKARNATQDFRRKLPTYQRQINTFLETPLGNTVASLALVWFFLSGWALRIFYVSLWFLPFAVPFIESLSKAAVVQGACPNCGTRYVGGRNRVVTCQRCRGVVWQPRQDFAKEGFFRENKSDPTIIDVNIENN